MQQLNIQNATPLEDYNMTSDYAQAKTVEGDLPRISNLQGATVLLDIDNTIYDGFIIEDLVAELNARGDFGADLTLFYEALDKYNQGIKGAGQELLRHFSAGFVGKSHEEMLLIVADLLTRNSQKFKISVLKLVQKILKEGGRKGQVVLATGEPVFVAEVVAYILRRDYRLDVVEIEGTVFDMVQGKFTGEITRYYDKAAVASKYAQANIGEIVAMGDHTDDIKMMDYADRAIGVNPSPGLLEWLTKRDRAILVYDNLAG